MQNNCSKYLHVPGSLCQKKLEEELDDAKYLSKLKRSLLPFSGVPEGATRILDFLHLGGEDEAHNEQLLRSLGVTHIINCAGAQCHTSERYYGMDFKYLGFNAEDFRRYNIFQHFDEVFTFIESARTSGGIVFIHCLMGVNRSAALVVAYLMVHRQLGPISAAVLVKKQRGTILANSGFQEQIISFGRRQNLLIKDELIVNTL